MTFCLVLVFSCMGKEHWVSSSHAPYSCLQDCCVPLLWCRCSTLSDLSEDFWGNNISTTPLNFADQRENDVPRDSVGCIVNTVVVIFCFINPYSYYIQRDFFRPSGIHEYFIHSFDPSYTRLTCSMVAFLSLFRLQIVVDNNACTEIKQVLYISSNRFEIYRTRCIADAC